MKEITLRYVGLGVLPPQYPTRVLTTPEAAAIAASGCQNQPNAKVAVLNPSLSSLPRNTRSGHSCKALDLVRSSDFRAIEILLLETVEILPLGSREGKCGVENAARVNLDKVMLNRENNKILIPASLERSIFRVASLPHYCTGTH